MMGNAGDDLMMDMSGSDYLVKQIQLMGGEAHVVWHTLTSG
jgi:hypothetical protein